jgi:hypothetical protein
MSSVTRAGALTFVVTIAAACEPVERPPPWARAPSCYEPPDWCVEDTAACADLDRQRETGDAIRMQVLAMYEPALTVFDAPPAADGWRARTPRDDGVVVAAHAYVIERAASSTAALVVLQEVIAGGFDLRFVLRWSDASAALYALAQDEGEERELGPLVAWDDDAVMFGDVIGCERRTDRSFLTTSQDASAAFCWRAGEEVALCDVPPEARVGSWPVALSRAEERRTRQAALRERLAE